MSIIVSYKNERIPIDFYGHPWNHITLQNLLDRVADATSLPADSLKLLHHGAVMRDPTASLAAYGLKDNSKVLLVASNPSERVHKSKQGNPDLSSSTDIKSGNTASTGIKSGSETSASLRLKQITSQLDHIMSDFESTIPPQIQKYESNVTEYLSDPSQTKLTYESLKYSHAYITESLMKILFKLDGIIVNDDISRNKRRETVKIVQGWQDIADELFAKVRKDENT
ncbi:hypothetical protein BKA69DRAFT_560875 [Paraphysoderma sedebokerense]|nr:hypothetical protein BKA69DRAFT_560875 [Paraphysoderma sedebokerense]